MATVITPQQLLNHNAVVVISIDTSSVGGIDVYHMIDRTLGTLGGIVIYVCDGSNFSGFQYSG